MLDGGIDEIDSRFTDRRRTTARAHAGGGSHRALVFDVRREPGGQRADRQVVRVATAVHASFHAASAQSRATLPCMHNGSSLNSFALARDLRRRIELQIDVGGVIDEQVADVPRQTPSAKLPCPRDAGCVMPASASALSV